jgi:hypothetical protein
LIEAPLPTYWPAATRDIEDACAASTGGEGPPMPREPAYADKRSQDGEAKSASE